MDLQAFIESFAQIILFVLLFRFAYWSGGKAERIKLQTEVENLQTTVLRLEKDRERMLYKVDAHQRAIDLVLIY